MEIAAVTVIHDKINVVKDTLDSVRRYMTEKIIVVADPFPLYKRLPTPAKLGGNNCDVYVGDNELFKDGSLPAYVVKGLKHNYYRAPYRNIMLGLQTAAKFWHADWFCVMDYDCLVVSDSFKDVLSNDYWIMGNDCRENDLKFPLLESLVNLKFSKSHYVLGCFYFINGEFVRKLEDIDFFNKFFCLTNEFKSGFFPGYNELTCYDIGEYLLPTIAVAMGRKIKELGCFSKNGWRGDPKFMLRFRPDINFNELSQDVSVLHPLKEYNSLIRNHYREIRNG